MRPWNPTAADPPSEDVCKLAAAFSPTAVLDIGCGTGRNLVPFDRRGCRLVGIDSDPQAITAARSRFSNPSADHAVFMLADLRTYETERRFDLVLCYGVLHFLLLSERLAAYRKLRAWVSSGGLVSIVMFNAVTPIPEDLRELMPEPASDSREILAAFGDWQVLHHRSYVYEDSHDDGKIQHTHSIDRLLAQCPAEGLLR